MDTKQALEILERCQRDGYANAKSLAEEALKMIREALEWQPMSTAPKDRPIVVKHKWTTGNFSIAELVRDDMVISVVDGDSAYNRDGEKQYFRLDELEGWREVE